MYNKNTNLNVKPFLFAEKKSVFKGFYIDLTFVRLENY